MSFYTITIFFITYLVCSVNPAILVCKLKTGEDIRKLGSGNAGSANAMRVLGKPLGIAVVLLDILKVFISFWIITFIGKIFNQDTGTLLKSIFMPAAVIGHAFPIYYGFKGGKGVIVGIATGFIVDSKVALVCLIVGVIVIIITRIVSIGTLAGTVLYIIMAIVMMQEYIVSVIITACVVMFRHKASIQRIVTNQEAKLW